MIKHIHCLFAVVNENETALIIAPKLNPFLLSEDVQVPMGRLRSDAQANICPQFLLGLSVICLFSSNEFEEKSGSTKILEFSQTSYYLT